jgi:formamidopyrimidine-DNA glycosylase
MPELPSLVIFKKYFDSSSINQKIKEVKVHNPEILIDIDADELKKSLINREFISSTRYGKYLFGELEKDLFLILHFGMTGFLDYHPSENGSTPHSRLSILFTNGNTLDFDDSRKFGKIGFTRDIPQFILEKKLGPDALDISYESFKELFNKRKGIIKPLLMNQNFLAGIGNLYADEILYQSSIHPLRKANDLKESDLHHLHENTLMVLKKAIEFQDKPHEFPSQFLLAHRYPGGECPHGGKLETLKVGGRTTYYCPDRQRL